MLNTFLKVYEARLLFLFLQEQIKDIIIMRVLEGRAEAVAGTLKAQDVANRSPGRL